MDACTWKWLLTLGGAGFELVGLALVLLDARDARRRARDVERRDQVVYPGRALARAKGREVTVTAGRQPTLEERVDRLERRLREVHRELDERIDRVDDAAQGEASRVRGEAMAHADTLDRTLREFLARALSGGRSVLGVAFFAIGLGLSAAANLVG